MIAMDTTVLGGLLFGTLDKIDSAEKLKRMDPDWISLEFLRVEIANVGWKYAKFAEMLVDEVVRRLEQVDIAVSVWIRDMDSKAILNMAMRDKLTFYGASHVWLARAKELKLYTRDKEILENCPDVARWMPEL